MRPLNRTRALARRAQRGISLVFSLMALVLLGLASVALIRSVDTNTLIMGNLAFKQDTLVASAAGTEQAIGWLNLKLADPKSLDADISANGYVANDLPKLDATGNQSSDAARMMVNWGGDNCAKYPTGSFNACDKQPFLASDVNGNRVQWFITRLCRDPGPSLGTNSCLRPATTAGTGAKERGSLKPDGRFTNTLASPYYRIIVRVEGPRNTVSYTESLVHF